MAEASSSTPELSRTERAVLRHFATHGGVCTDGHAAIGLAIDAGERSVQRAVSTLAHKGLLKLRRHGPKAAEALLTTDGKRVAMDLLPQEWAHTPMGPSAHSPTRTTTITSARPVGFIGDANALGVARIVIRIGKSDAPSDLAAAYLQHAAPSELARLLNLLDEYEQIPSSVNPTRYEPLDDGLRAHFRTQSQRARAREAAKRGLAGLAKHAVSDED